MYVVMRLSNQIDVMFVAWGEATGMWTALEYQREI